MKCPHNSAPQRSKISNTKPILRKQNKTKQTLTLVFKKLLYNRLRWEIRQVYQNRIVIVAYSGQRIEDGFHPAFSFKVPTERAVM